MSKKGDIHPELKNLDFSQVDIFELVIFLVTNYNDMSLFEPLSREIKAEHYIEFLRGIPNADYFASLMNNEACEYIRLQILHTNGYETEDGFHRSRNDIVSPYKHWI